MPAYCERKLISGEYCIRSEGHRGAHQDYQRLTNLDYRKKRKQMGFVEVPKPDPADGERRYGPVTPEDLAREFLAVQMGSVEDAMMMAEDIPEGDERDEIMNLIEQFGQEREDFAVDHGISYRNSM